jgi:ribosomal protein S18 acetylase RimI-like enzyme
VRPEIAQPSSRDKISPMTFQIRPAQLADASSIAHVQVEGWWSTYQGIVPDRFLASLDKEERAENWKQQLADPAIHFFVAEDETGVFGFITGGAIRDSAEDYDGELYAIYLLQSHQQQGAGRALLRSLTAAMRDAGFRSMLVWALEENRPAIAFYKRVGAIPVTSKIINISGKDLSDLALGWTSLVSLL